MNFTTVGSHSFGPQIDAVAQYISISYESLPTTTPTLITTTSGSPITKAHAVLN